VNTSRAERLFQNSDLVAQCQILKSQFPLRLEEREYGSEDACEHSEHRDED
jgi:hypothetical protein